MPRKYADCDFHGWATKYDLRCSDGKTIRQGAFSGTGECAYRRRN